MIVRSSRNGPIRRRGFGLIEMAISGLLLAAAMAATVQVVGWVALDRRSVARRERAVVEASNLMERIAARPFDEITPESLAALKLPEAARASLPGSVLSATVAAQDDAPARKRISVEIRWRDRSGNAGSPVRLVAWTYRKGGPVR
jgi:Tfp pilus assembly protein PilV